MDTKKIDPTLAPWDAQTEQSIFGNQAPYATGPHTSTAPSTDLDDEAPSIYQAHPYRPHTTQFSPSSAPYLAGSLPKYSPAPDLMPTAPSLNVQTQLSEQHPPQQTSEPAMQSEHRPRSHQPSQQQQPPIQPFTRPSNDMWDQSTSFSPLYEHQNSPIDSQSSPFEYGSMPPHGHQGPPGASAPFFRDRRSDSPMSRSGSGNSTSEHEPLIPKREGKNKNTWALLRRYNRFIIGCIFLLMLVIYFVCRVLILYVDPCAMTSDSSMPYTDIQSLDTMPQGEISISLQDHIPGNVVIRENDDWNENNVVVKFSKRSTSTKVLDDMFLLVEASTDPFLRVISLLRTEDADERKKLLRGHCTKMEIELVYPRGVSYPQLLRMNGVLGNIHVQLDSPTAILDRIHLDVIDGNILVDGVSIREKATFRVARGKIQGKMRSIGEVNMESIDGDIDVVLHPSLAFLDMESENLNVTMRSLEGSINLVMAQRYQGHFSLNSGKKQSATFLGSSAYPDVVRYSAHSESRSEGWITEDGEKPAMALPRLAVNSDAGSAVVLIQDISLQA